MTEIKIKRLSLENFKCHRALTLTFNGGNASIYGDNATGKTSIYDALTWLLFGKDSSGNGEKNIEIKPLDKYGEVKDHDALTAVEAVLYVNGEELIEPYVDELAFGYCDIQLPYQVPDERYFVIGDHRSVSLDSRSSSIGCVATEQIVGRIVFRVWPVKDFGAVAMASDSE